MSSALIAPWRRRTVGDSSTRPPSTARSQTTPARRGAKRLLATIDTPILTRSELEDAFLTLARETNLPHPEVNARVAGLEVDFHWPDHALVVETDGATFHAPRAAREHDRRREAILARAGIRTHRFTHRQVIRDPRDVQATLRALLENP